MALVQDILSAKGTRVYTITPDATVYEATTRMNQHKIGALVVTPRDEPNRVLGIFTERDVLRRVVAQLRYPDLVLVGEVMTSPLVICHPFTDMSEAAALMTEHRVRHLPVIDRDNRLAGLISIGDINAWQVARAEATVTELSDYICGRS